MPVKKRPAQCAPSRPRSRSPTRPAQHARSRSCSASSESSGGTTLVLGCQNEAPAATVASKACSANAAGLLRQPDVECTGGCSMDFSDYTPRDIMHERCQDLLMRLPEGCMERASTRLARMMRESGVDAVRLGSVCSGSGIGELAVIEVMASIGRATGVDLKHSTEFCCEIIKEKKDWLQAQGIAPIIFQDAEQMGNEVAFDWTSNSLQRVPDVDVLSAGFSCKDLSNLNDKRKDMQSHIDLALESLTVERLQQHMDATGSTATTLLGVFRYVSKHLPAFVILENVPNVLRIIDKLFAILGKCGYLTGYLEVTPERFGVPQTRPRVYIYACSRSMLEVPISMKLKSVEEKAQEAVGDILKTMMSSSSPSLDAFLWPCEVVARMLASKSSAATVGSSDGRPGRIT